MSCLKAGHILSNCLKITIFCFSSTAMSVKSEILGKKSNFRNSSKITHVHSLLQLSVQNFCHRSHQFSLQTFIWSLWRISTHTNLQIRTIHLIILSMGMACFHPLARRCFPKTRSLRPIRFCTLNKLNRD